MSAKRLLEEMLILIQAQIEAVVHGDAEAVLTGTARHEQLLSLLQAAELDGIAEELRALKEQIDLEKVRLESLLVSETARLDYLLRLILGGGQRKPDGYPGVGSKPEVSSRMLNRRA